jgi:acetyl-CoA C-acetyltransferase
VDQAKLEAMPSPPFTAEASGSATIETYTVAFGRDGEPETGIVIGRLDDGTRFFANTPADAGLLREMTRAEQIGRQGTVAVEAETQRNIFTPA